jgi:hypothetical protein
MCGGAGVPSGRLEESGIAVEMRDRAPSRPRGCLSHSPDARLRGNRRIVVCDPSPPRISRSHLRT